MYREKDQLILNVFQFLDTGDLAYANKARDLLKELARRYRVTLRKNASLSKDLKIALIEFLENKKGYANKSGSLAVLYNSI